VLPLRCEDRDCALYLETQTPFSGVLHGNDHVVSGLKLPGTLPAGTVSGYEEALYFGLFGYISTAYIHDVTVRVANTDEDRAAYSSASIATNNVQPSFGVLAGLSRGSRIVNVHIEADTDSAGAGLYVSGPVSTTSSYTNIGGVVGRGFDTLIADSVSSVPLDVYGLGNDYIGGIAGTLSGEINHAEVTGQITVINEGAGVGSNVAGISAAGGAFIRNCTVTMDALTLTAAGATNGATALSGIGYGTVTDSTVNINLIKVYSSSTVARSISVGGISSTAGGSIERSHARFNKIEVAADDDAVLANVSVGGIVAGGSVSKVSYCTIESDEGIVVNLPTIQPYGLIVGGLAGTGNVSHSSIPGGFRIAITTGASIVTAGGLTGQGSAEYSFAGTKDNHATLNVMKPNPGIGTSYAAAVGGICGNAAPSAAAPFRYNYSFCDVTLITAGATVSSYAASAHAVGGLAGTIGTGLFTESFAAGSVTLTDNYAGTIPTLNEDQSGPVVRVGGIAGSANSESTTVITKCAALSNSVVLDGSSTIATGVKTWRRISHPAEIDEEYMGTVFTNNIAKIGGTPPDGYTPTDNANGRDGLAVTEITAYTFFGTETGQLGWNRDVWTWDGGYPVLK
jgi:hypothetical protein